MDKLTVFQQKVLAGKSEGLSDREIAIKLNCNARRIPQALKIAKMKMEATKK